MDMCSQMVHSESYMSSSLELLLEPRTEGGDRRGDWVDCHGQIREGFLGYVKDFTFFQWSVGSR